MRLVESFPDQSSFSNKVTWASSCGRFIARKEFCSQCHILLLDITRELCPKPRPPDPSRPGVKYAAQHPLALIFEKRVAVASAGSSVAPLRCSHSNLLFANPYKTNEISTFVPTIFMLRVSFSPAPDCVDPDCWNHPFSTAGPGTPL